MRNADDNYRKREPYRRKSPYKDDPFLFAKVVDATLVMDPDPDEANSKYIWRYEVSPAKMIWAGLGNLPSTDYRQLDPVTSAPTPTYYAFSISELGNVLSTFVAYGVDTGVIPAGPEPVRIPDDTPVLCRAMRNYETGEVFYLIINTQAISGACA